MLRSTHWHVALPLGIALAASPVYADEDAGVASCGHVEFDPRYGGAVPINFDGVLVRRAPGVLDASEVTLEQTSAGTTTAVPFTLETIGPGEWRVRPDGALTPGARLYVSVAACEGASPEDRYGIALDLTDEAPAPTDLGTFVAMPVVRLHTGAALLSVRYTPSAATEPWARAWWGAIQVDGVDVDGPRALGAFLDGPSEGYAHWLDVACSPGASGITPGTHTLRFVGGPHGGAIAGTSNELTVQVDCPPIPPPPDPNACIDGGIGPDGMHHTYCPADAGPPLTCPDLADGQTPQLDDAGRPICGDAETDPPETALCSASPGRGAPILMVLFGLAALALARRKLSGR